MNICFYCKFNGGGTERATALLAEALAESHNVVMLSTSLDEPTFSHKNVSFQHLNGKGVLDQIVKLMVFIKNNKIDVLVSLEALSGIIAIPAAKMSGCKLIIWEHANYYQDQGSKNTTTLRKIDLIFADAYVLLTKRDMRNFKSHFKFIRTKLCQIYNIAELRGSCTYSSDSHKIVSVGHINKIKNFIIIPDIAKIVLSKYPDWRWEIYGDVVGHEYEKIKYKLKSYNLEDKVLFRGYELSLDKIYSDAAIYVMTSLQEGYPMVLLEAKSYGIPVVSFDIETGPDEMIEDGINGFLVRPYDIDRMASAIEKLIEDRSLRMQFSSQARKRLDNSCRDVVAKQWNQLLDEII
jgi:glycosyltransferase involved in cell wall biosynthesis